MTSGPTILAVDDTTESLSLLVQVLTTAGYQVLPADSGELALAAVTARCPELILLDVRMPGIDGFEVCRRLKSSPATRHVPIILISAFDEVNEQAEGLRLGAADYITKPFQTEELLARVETHLALSQAQASLRRQAAELLLANEALQAEVARREVVASELRQNLERADQVRRAMLSALEDQKRAEALMAAHANHQAAIAELGQLALTDIGLQAWMDRVVERVAAVLDVEYCKILELVPDRSVGLLRAGVGWPKGLVGHATVSLGLDSQAGFTLQSQQPVILEDLRTETRFHGPPLLHDHSVVSGLSTIIGELGQPFGVLGVHSTRRRDFTAHEVNFVQTVAHLVANAVLRHAQQAEIERVNRLYATLSQVNQAVVRCVSRDELFQQLCRVAVDFAGFQSAWVGMKAGGGVAAMAQCAGAPTLRQPGQPHSCGVVEEATRTGLPSLSNDAGRDPRTACCHEALIAAGVRSCGAFPFRSRGRVGGVFGLHSKEADFFSADEVRLLDEIAQDISHALEHLDRESQLLQSQKMEGIGRLAGGVAHDFNNLLTAILSYTGFAMEGVREGDPLKDDLLEVKKAGERAAALTRQLLAFSRKQVLQPVPLDLNRVVSEMERMLRRIIGEDIDLAQVLSPDLGMVKADPGQLEQVILNLAVNARDAMPEGGNLTIETANVEFDADDVAQHPGVEPGAHVMVAVTDSGVGMDQAILAQVFEPFFTTKGPGKGTGLGLSTVYGIVKQSGGYIWAYSERGKGTTFKVFLPRHDANPEALKTPTSPVLPSGGSETILVVEDDSAVRGLTQRILKSAGYKVLTAANGGEALLTCEQHHGTIDLVLTDVVMPQMSGRVLAERLTKVRPDARVLFASGYTANAIVHQGALDPGTNFIGKPFTQAGLLTKVREVLDAPSEAGPRCAC